MVERFNRTMTDMLAKHVGSKQEEWYEYLKQVQVEYNSHPHAVTGYSPYYLVYGQNPSLAESVLLDVNRDPEPQSVWEDNLAIAADRIQVAHQKEAERWNAHVQWAERRFQVGEQVLVWHKLPKTNTDKQVHCKLVCGWEGTYVVLNKMDGK
ncbi:MAG: hypothetical protein ACK56F_32420, partial [bacterium]